MRSDNLSDYIAALEFECERANILIGVLRHAAEGHPRASADEPFYTTYRDARDSRYASAAIGLGPA